jgi:hypothetical protein
MAPPSDTAATPAQLADRVRGFSTFAPWAQQDPVSAFNEMREFARVPYSEEFEGF